MLGGVGLYQTRPLTIIFLLNRMPHLRKMANVCHFSFAPSVCYSRFLSFFLLFSLRPTFVSFFIIFSSSLFLSPASSFCVIIYIPDSLSLILSTSPSLLHYLLLSCISLLILIHVFLCVSLSLYVHL